MWPLDKRTALHSHGKCFWTAKRSLQFAFVCGVYIILLIASYHQVQLGVENLTFQSFGGAISRSQWQLLSLSVNKLRNNGNYGVNCSPSLKAVVRNGPTWRKSRCSMPVVAASLFIVQGERNKYSLWPIPPFRQPVFQLHSSGRMHYFSPSIFSLWYIWR